MSHNDGTSTTYFSRKIIDIELTSCRVLSSIHLNARQPEMCFPSFKLAAKGQNSVYDMLQRSSSSISAKDSEQEGRTSNG
jgi:hypothetical protein